jgi:hypothetical protein
MLIRGTSLIAQSELRTRTALVEEKIVPGHQIALLERNRARNLRLRHLRRTHRRHGEPSGRPS